jgi:parallel beta-helix repeat protein
MKMLLVGMASFLLAGVISVVWIALPDHEAMAAGNTYYVSKQGNDGNACTSPGTGACLTIRGGASKMSGGDTLLIQAGTYDEYLTYGKGFPWKNGSSASSRTRYARYQNDVVIVRPQQSRDDHVVAFLNNNYIEIDGLILDGGNIEYDGIKIEEYQGSATGIRIANSEIKDARGGGSVCIRFYGNGGGSHEVVNNTIHNCSFYGVYVSTRNPLIDGNRIYDNGGFAIHQFSMMEEPAIIL